MITREIINVYVPDKNLRMLLVFSGTLLAIYLVKFGLNYFMTYYGHYIGLKMQMDMRSTVFSHLQKLPFSYYDEHQSGALMSRVVNDLEGITELAHHGPEMLLTSCLMIIGSFIFLCSINLPLTLIVFALLPVFLFFTLFMRKRMDDGFMKSRKTMAKINAELQN